MIDIVIRDCGYGEWLPIIVVTSTGKELYRGNRYKSFASASERAKTAWDESLTQNIRDVKEKHSL